MVRRFWKDDPNYTKEAKEKLNLAFKRFRRELKVVARQNYLCCMSCGCAAGWDYIEKHPKKKFEGLVFYHRQDAEAMREEGQVHLRFSTKDGGEPSRRLGSHLVEILKDVGLHVEWTGSPDHCIYVDLREEAEAPLVIASAAN